MLKHSCRLVNFQYKGGTLTINSFPLQKTLKTFRRIILPISNAAAPLKQRYNAYIDMHGEIVAKSITREMRY